MSRSLILVIVLAGVLAAAPSAVASAPETREPGPAAFPADALMPKKEIGADRFLEEFPEYDGRGVVVAIFDSGTDPGAPGLQTTTTGEPKIIDVVDASGSGDVDTSTKRELREDGTIESLSGRALRPDPDWNNPAGEWRVGQKPAWELFPGALVDRLKEERRDDFQERQRQAVADAKRVLEDWDADHSQPTRDELEERRDLEARIDLLEKMMESWDDPGPIFDCLVFHDGDKWRAAIDTDEDGNFDDEKTLTNYRDEREWATFGDRDLMNYVLNIYEEGDRLSIVADADDHGTHVAGIVAAHYPDKPEMNGIAPGAQLVVVKIGDTRLGSTSVGTGDVRGFVAALANGAELVNMSYGGPTRIPNDGRLETLRAEFVNEHGVIFVATAGNSGPALSSLGGPGGTSTATLGIGATISPEMMAAQYSIRDPYAEQAYNWSSRGPAADGWLGVDFCAPGGAVAPVTNWTLRGNAQMNGTSMAAPSVCGSAALLLSGLKDRGVAYSPQSVRRALANTARPLDGTDAWGQGTGVIQVDTAWQHLLDHAGRDDVDVRYEMSIGSRRGARGIYLREPFENDRPWEGRVMVRPIFPEDADNRDKVAFEKRVLLQSTAGWVQVAGSVHMPHGGESFVVKVDPTALPPGAHYAEVRGTDTGNPQYGPLFRIPVTVTRTWDVSEKVDWTHRETFGLRPGQVVRRFLEIPEGATWADIRMRRRDAGTNRTVVLQTVQLLDHQAYTDHGLRSYMAFTEGEVETRSIEVTGGRTVEVALVQHWSSLGESELQLEVEFHGLRPSDRSISFSTLDEAYPVDVTAARLASIEPKGSFRWLRKTLLAEDVDVRPLGSERDQLWEGRQIYEMAAKYALEVTDSGDHAVLPAFGFLPHAEDTYESAMWYVMDENGRRVAVGTGAEWDAVKLEEGEYDIYLHVRHDDPEALETLGKMALYVDRRLGKPVSLGVHSHSRGGDEGGAPFGRRDLRPGQSARVWLTPPDPDDWPDGAEPGDALRGSMTFGRERTDLDGPGNRPGGWPVEVTVAPKPEEDDDEPEAKKEDEPSELEKLAEEVRDLRVERLEKLADGDDDEAFETLASRILDDWPDHLPVLVARLQRADSDDDHADTGAIVSAADAVIDAVDRTELAAHFGTSIDEDDPAAKEERKERKEERDALREALMRKARALRAAASADRADAAAREKFESAWTELEKWADPEDDDFVSVRVDRERLLGRPGSALELLNERIADADDAAKALYEQRVELLEELGWDHWADTERRALAVRFPVTELVF